MATHDPPSIDPEPEFPGPCSDIGMYYTRDERLVIYDERISGAWLSSTYSVSLVEAE